MAFKFLEQRISKRAKQRLMDIFAGVIKPDQEEAMLLKEMGEQIQTGKGGDLGIAKVVSPMERGEVPLAQSLRSPRPKAIQPGTLERMAQGLFVSKKRFKELTTGIGDESGEQQALQLLFGHREPQSTQDVKALEKVRGHVIKSKEKGEFNKFIQEFMLRREKATQQSNKTSLEGDITETQRNQEFNKELSKRRQQWM